MRNRRIILLVQLQLRKTLEVAEMPLYSFPHFFSVVLHFFFLFFPFFIIFFFHLSSVSCVAPSYISSFYLFSFSPVFSVSLLLPFDKRCSPKRTVTLDEAVAEMEEEEKTEDERAGGFVRNSAKCC